MSVCQPYNNQYFCATSLKSDGRYSGWDYCDATKCPNKGETIFKPKLLLKLLQEWSKLLLAAQRLKEKVASFPSKQKVTLMSPDPLISCSPDLII